MAGTLVSLVVPNQGSYPVKTSWDQVDIHMLTFFIACYVCPDISHLYRKKSYKTVLHNTFSVI